MPHLAAFTGLTVADSRHIVFSEWFCPKTIENLAGNPTVAVAVLDSATGKDISSWEWWKKPRTSAS
jgi:hypothetical protein